MKKRVVIIIVIGALVLLALVGCNGRLSNGTTIGDTVVQKQGVVNCRGKYVVVFRNDTIPFFGESLILDDSAHVMQQIKEISEKDTMLSVDGRVLTVGEVGFGINVNENGVILISSVQIDDLQMKPVVQYLKNLYGNPSDADPENGCYWFDKDIRVRRLHSEEGGTTIIFNGVIKNDEETPER